jgi:3-methyl-2-oxobutanoate hydroxymethyltransferase
MMLIEDAQCLEQAGVFSLVAEKVTQEVASIISRSLKIPVIGIGSGADVDGQVLVSYDLLGIFNEYMPRFIKRYANLADQIRNAILQYNSDVRTGLFPSKEQSYHLSSTEEKAIKKMLQMK